MPIKKEKLSLKLTWKLLVETTDQFIDDKGLKMAAALSFYAAFSVGPLLIIVISIAGIFFGEDAARGEISRQITYLVGPDSAEMIEDIIKGASNKTTGIIAGLVSIIFLVLGSVGVFLELQESLNIIWGVELKPGRGIWGFVKNRLISFSMVVATGFLMMVSLLINSIIYLLYNFLNNYFDNILPASEAINIISSFIIITLLFAMIFKYLPDVLISWRYVWFGAVITSVLFSIGKYFIGLYLGNSSYSSTYGAAASLVIMFIWIYYSGIILFFGAEFTQVYRNRFSLTELKPNSDGIKIKKVSELIKASIDEDGKVIDTNTIDSDIEKYKG
ncbi:MAG: YihY/virulence factor BrkB family protein [Ignavibacteria bacterium]|nr:YihY/virulence factor BrkB family protein [Ignavibacteria bacterium]